MKNEECPQDLTESATCGKNEELKNEAMVFGCMFAMFWGFDSLFVGLGVHEAGIGFCVFSPEGAGGSHELHECPELT